jgi:hypothetical protein
MNATTQLFVKSHVARDLLQNAGLFKSDKLVGNRSVLVE